VGNESPLGNDAERLPRVTGHELEEGLGHRLWKQDFVEVEGGGPGQVEASFPLAPREDAVHVDGGAAGGKGHHERGTREGRGLEDGGAPAGHFGRAAQSFDLHSSVKVMRRTPARLIAALTEGSHSAASSRTRTAA